MNLSPPLPHTLPAVVLDGPPPWTRLEAVAAMVVLVLAVLLVVMVAARWRAPRLRREPQGAGPGSWPVLDGPVRPPPVAGAPAPRFRDVWRILWWSQVGFAHGARHGRPSERVASAVLAGCCAILLPLLAIVQPALVWRPRTRYYMTPERDAVLALAADRDGWTLEDHASAAPGTGRGRTLRAQVMPTVLAAADQAGVPIHATAASTTLAAIYTTDIPGMTDLGPRRTRRARRRDPGTAR